MAVKNSIQISPDSGSGNGQLTLQAQTANLGNRVIKTAKFTVATPGDGPSVELTANLAAAAEFVRFTGDAADGNQAIEKAGGSITVTGQSNSATLTVTKGSGDIISGNITLTVNGEPATSGTAIAGDPGASAAYEFELTFTASANETVETKSQTITVKGVASGSSTTATVTLNQAAGDPEISIDPDTITVPQDGTEVTVQVTSNTTWTVA